MPSPLRDPKAISDWIEMDYYRRPRRLRKVRALLIWLAFLGCPVLLAWSFWPRQRAAFEAGPLSNSHAMFNEQCSLCHVDSFQTARRFWPSQAESISIPDAACQKCHDGPPHHESVHTAQPHCASCHREHRGQAVLERITDGHCTGCHANLEREVAGACQFQNVRTFAEHPEFKLWRGERPMDATQLYFNHQAHLKAEGVLGPGGRAEHLDCAACHQLDATRRYLQPVQYQNHCASCHSSQLSVRIQGETKDPSMRQAIQAFQQQPAPHQSPDVIRAALRERLTRLAENKAALELHAPDLPRPLPWEPQPEPGKATAESRWTWVNYQLQEMERPLFDGAGGCRYCHVKREGTATAARPDRLPAYLPTSMPARWYEHSQFNHTSHRMTACTECHAAHESQLTSDVLMPRMGTCQKCHNPQVGVSSTCFDCHSYHNRREAPGWQGKMTIEQSLGNP